MCGGGRHASFPLSTSKVALWQEASSLLGDEGLTRAMEDQMLSRKAQVKSLMIFNAVMLSVLFCSPARQILLGGSPMAKSIFPRGR